MVRLRSLTIKRIRHELFTSTLILGWDDVALYKKMRFDVAVHLPGEGQPSAKLQGTAGPVNLANIINTPFLGKLTLDKVPLSAVQQYAHADSLNDMEATVSGATELQNLSGQIASKGDLNIEQSRIHGTEIGYPIKAVYDIAYDLAPGVAHIKNAQVESRLHAAGRERYRQSGRNAHSARYSSFGEKCRTRRSSAFGLCVRSRFQSRRFELPAG